MEIFQTSLAKLSSYALQQKIKWGEFSRSLVAEAEHLFIGRNFILKENLLLIIDT